MTGIQAIAANNGWAMAATGAIIVMVGLAILSFLISQLHKVIALFEKRADQAALPENYQPDEKPVLFILDDMAATARIYKSISTQLGEKFELVKLYQLLNNEALPHTHLTIRSLREAGYLIPCGDGIFCWKTE